MMRTWFTLCNMAYWLALFFWTGAIFSAAVAAAGVFGAFPRLGVSMPRYEAALGENLIEHGRLAGGMVMEPIFAATDLVQCGAAIVVVSMLFAQLAIFKMSLRKIANLARALAIAVAAVLLALHVAMIAPRMNGELRATWKAADAGLVQEMNAHRAAFNADHITAYRLSLWRFVALLVATAASAAAFSPGVDRRQSRPSTSTLLQ